ncbi:MAG: hypothetical protein IPJ32_21015 [Sphingobacteriaceae bacterium]|nr:hypothetical protein [Sphingobacteriaceae bacterium]
MNKIIIIFLFVSYNLSIAQPIGTFPRRLPQASNTSAVNCEGNIKVNNVIPSSCYLNPLKYCAYHPVFEENFDYKMNYQIIGDLI